jgi:hypothetical protein
MGKKRKGRIDVSIVSGNAEESIAELQAHLVITLPKAGIDWLLVSCTLLRIPITPRPVTWKLAFSEHPKALICGGILSMQMHRKPLLLVLLSDVWIVWRRSLGRDNELRVCAALGTIAE